MAPAAPAAPDLPSASPPRIAPDDATSLIEDAGLGIPADAGRASIPSASGGAGDAVISEGKSRSAARRAPLSRERMLAAALELVDSDGIEALTMRRLARKLLKDPMALYRHATSRAALLDGITEVVLSQLEIPTEAEDWQDALRLSAHAYRQLALDHPNVVPLIVTRPLATPLGLRPPGTLRPLEGILALLIGAGFTPVDALRTYRLYIGFLNGHILNELQQVIIDPDEDEDLLRLGLYRLPPRDFPHIRSLATHLATYNGATELDQGLEVLMSGLQAHHHAANGSTVIEPGAT